jgi:glycosyltransferase involved in cell wall biosynthesis
MTLRVAYFLPELETSGDRTQVRLLQQGLPTDRYQTRLFGFVTDRSLQGNAEQDEFRLCRSLSIDPFPLLKMAREIRSWKPDLLHTWRVAKLGIESWWPLKNIARWRVATVHNPASGPAPLIPGRATRWLAHCHRVTATSQFMGRQLENDCPNTRLEVIPAAVERYDEEHASSSFRETLGIPSSAPCIALLGSDAHQERFRDALEMMELLCAVNDNLHMVVLGRGAKAPWIGRFCRQLEIDSRVHVPASGCWQQVLAEATLLLLPAQSRGTSTSLLHALSASLPLVLADTPANRSIVDERCAEFFPAGDSGQCARQVHQLLKDPSRLASMAEAGQVFFESLNKVQQMVTGYDSLYQDLVAGG